MKSGFGTANLDYYTISFAAQKAELAEYPEITAQYGEEKVASGDIVVGGKTLVLTATAQGGDYYEYAWMEGGNILSTEGIFTVEKVASKQDYTCIITGMRHYNTSTEFGSITEPGKDAVCIFDAPFDDLIGVDINGVRQQLIDKGDGRLGIYGPDDINHDFESGVVESGSTIVTLYAAYLDTLPNGVYEVKAYFKQGMAASNLTIARQDSKPTPGPTPKDGPRTGDARDLGTWCIVMALSAVAVVVLRRKSAQR